MMADLDQTLGGFGTRGWSRSQRLTLAMAYGSFFGFCLFSFDGSLPPSASGST